MTCRFLALKMVPCVTDVCIAIGSKERSHTSGNFARAGDGGLAHYYTQLIQEIADVLGRGRRSLSVLPSIAQSFSLQESVEKAFKLFQQISGEQDQLNE
jgi:hypothetical protein